MQKSNARFLIVAAAAAVCLPWSVPSFGQTDAPVLTAPVGYVTLPIDGSENAGTTNFSFRSLGLVRLVEFEGTVSSAAGKQITVENAAWSEDQFSGAAGPHYLEITGGPGGVRAGVTYDVMSTSASGSQLTLAQDLPAALPAGTTFRIRKHWTLSSVFGPANESGLRSGSEGDADTIVLQNGGSAESYYYRSGGGAGAGWRKQGDSATDQANRVIYPEDGLVISRRSPGTLRLQLVGAVKEGQSSFPIFPGRNVLSNPYAIPMTLASSRLHTGDGSTGLASGFSSTADQVLIYNGVGYDTYYYSTGGLAGVGWRKVGAGKADASATELPVGAAFVVHRHGTTGFDWISPAHPAATQTAE